MSQTSSAVPLFSATAANSGIDFIGPISAVLDRHWYVLGQEVDFFEKEFAEYIGVDHCVSVASGSDALELALRAVRVKPGDEVITVANAGFYGSTAIHAVGATPLYVDVDDRTLTIDPASVAEALKARKAAAIIVTHLYGQLAAVQAVIRLAAEAGIPVIEDCAQAHGAASQGRKAGSFGDIGCFSFYPTKNLGALGDGGAVVTSDPALAKRLTQLRQYGWSKKYHVTLPGGRNSRLDELQAAILRTKLPLLDGWNEQRRHIARSYSAAFTSLPMQLPSSTGDDYVAHLYVVRVNNRADFAAALERQRIATDVHYPIADHRQEAYSTPTFVPLTVTERACESVISLPCFPGMGQEQTDRVIKAVLDYFADKS